MEQPEHLIRKLASSSCTLLQLGHDAEFLKLSKLTSVSLFLGFKFYEEVNVASAALLCEHMHT